MDSSTPGKSLAPTGDAVVGTFLRGSETVSPSSASSNVGTSRETFLYPLKPSSYGGVAASKNIPPRFLSISSPSVVAARIYSGAHR